MGNTTARRRVGLRELTSQRVIAAAAYVAVATTVGVVALAFVWPENEAALVLLGRLLLAVSTAAFVLVLARVQAGRRDVEFVQTVLDLGTSLLQQALEGRQVPTTAAGLEVEQNLDHTGQPTVTLRRGRRVLHVEAPLADGDRQRVTYTIVTPLRNEVYEHDRGRYVRVDADGVTELEPLPGPSGDDGA